MNGCFAGILGCILLAATILDAIKYGAAVDGAVFFVETLFALVCLLIWAQSTFGPR